MRKIRLLAVGGAVMCLLFWLVAGSAAARPGHAGNNAHANPDRGEPRWDEGLWEDPTLPVAEESVDWYPWITVPLTTLAISLFFLLILRDRVRRRTRELAHSNLALRREVEEHEYARNALETSERRFRQIVEALPLGVHMYRVETDGNLIFTEANPAADRLLGVNHRQFIGRRIEEAFPALAGTEIPARYLATALRGEPFHAEQFVYRDDQIGGAFEVHATQTAPGQVVALFADITERKLAEEALKDAEERYHALVEATTDAVFVETPDGRVLHCNRAACDIYGCSRAEMLQLTVADLVPPEVAAALPALAERQLAEGGMRVEAIGRRKDGSLFPIEVSTRLIQMGGEPRIVAFVRDITERKRNEQALRVRAQWLRTTLTCVGDAVITTDTDGRINFLNPTAARLSGWSLDDALGKPLSTVFHIINELSLAEVENPVAKVIRERRVVGLANHTLLIGRDGSRRPIADSGAPILDEEGRLLGVVLVFRDMTGQRAMEAQLRQQQKLEAIGTLAAGVAHEVNNPIQAILGYGALIVHEAPPDSALARNGQEILAECRRISEIIRNLLTFARQEKGERQPADLLEIVRATLSLANKLLIKDRITVRLELPERLPTVVCQSQQIQQVVMNLLTNARDALNERYPEGGPDKWLRIGAERFDRDGRGWVRVTVEDRGVGIPPELMERIFDPFFTTKPVDKGTGLGLSVSHGIVREHNGRLYAESEVGQYARFHLELPTQEEVGVKSTAGTGELLAGWKGQPQG